MRTDEQLPRHRLPGRRHHANNLVRQLCPEIASVTGNPKMILTRQVQGRVARAIALVQNHEGAPSKLCFGGPATPPAASAPLGRYLPALFGAPSAATRFLLGRPSAGTSLGQRTGVSALHERIFGTGEGN